MVIVNMARNCVHYFYINLSNIREVFRNVYIIDFNHSRHRVSTFIKFLQTNTILLATLVALARREAKQFSRTMTILR